LLILGGPGSGKTTIALVKAATELAARSLLPGQKILFLSFARATIARVMEQAKVRIPREYQRELEINTYHGFAWSFIQTFGHLLTGYARLARGCRQSSWCTKGRPSSKTSSTA